MSATAARPAARFERPTTPPPQPAEGVELLGDVHGSGYKEGAALVRRADGQVVQLGPVMYALLACADGRRDRPALAAAMSDHLGRTVGDQHVARIAQKLAAQGLLAGSEHNAPARRNPLLALRWKVLVTNPTWTRRLTAPFAQLFRPWIVWPVLAAFVGVFWFVMIDKGIASAAAQAFHRPELLLLVFGLAILSAGFHEFGHAAACRYAGGTPGGMGVGIYMVWPAFYTEVTDAYRMPRRDRLRVDLGGLYFNAIVAVVTMGVWLLVRADALLLLVALQLLQMVKQLSPVIRADGYHILADATGVPDLFAHIGPTLRRLIPGRRNEPSALTGRARFLVTAWVLLVVPVLLSLMLSAIVLFPRLAASAWVSGRQIASAMPHEDAIEVLASVVRLFALALPVLGTALVSQKVIRTVARKGAAWSSGRPLRRTALLAGTALAIAVAAWAWWPSGQYTPIRAGESGTLPSLVRVVSAPATVARPQPRVALPPSVHLAPGRHLAVAMIPVGGATRRHPAFFVIKGGHGRPPAMIVSTTAPDPAAAPAASPSTPGTTAPPPSSATAPPAASATVPAAAFTFKLPSAPGPGDSQALGVNHTDGGVKYDIAYSLVTVHDGSPVTNKNSAWAFANCKACTTVAVSFQVVLVIGQSNVIAPMDVAGSLNVNCPACLTMAIADQIVVTLESMPSSDVMARLQTDLQQLDGISSLGSPNDIANEVATVQHEVETELVNSGLVANQQSTSTTSTGSPTTTTPSPTSTTPTSTTPQPTSTTPTSTTPATTDTTQTTTEPTQTTTTDTTPTTTTDTTPTTTTTTTAP